MRESNFTLDNHHRNKPYGDIIEEFIVEYANPRTGWKLSQSFVIQSLNRVGAFKRIYTEANWRFFDKQTTTLLVNDDIYLQIDLAKSRLALSKFYNQNKYSYDLIEMILKNLNRMKYKEYRKFQIYIGQRYQNQKARLSQINDMKRSLSQINR